MIYDNDSNSNNGQKKDKKKTQKIDTEKRQESTHRIYHDSHDFSSSFILFLFNVLLSKINLEKKEGFVFILKN